MLLYHNFVCLNAMLQEVIGIFGFEYFFGVLGEWCKVSELSGGGFLAVALGVDYQVAGDM